MNCIWNNYNLTIKARKRSDKFNVENAYLNAKIEGNIWNF